MSRQKEVWSKINDLFKTKDNYIKFACKEYLMVNSFLISWDYKPPRNSNPKTLKAFYISVNSQDLADACHSTFDWLEFDRYIGGKTELEILSDLANFCGVDIVEHSELKKHIRSKVFLHIQDYKDGDKSKIFKTKRQLVLRIRAIRPYPLKLAKSEGMKFLLQRIN